MAEGKWIDELTPDQPAEQAAVAVLTARLAAVSLHLPLAVHEADTDTEHVHQLRVATRRAGAALSMFRPVLSKKFHKQAKEVLRAVRRAAGEARDWDVFLELLAASESLAKPTSRAALDFLTGYGLGHRSPAQANLVLVAAERTDQLAALERDLPSELRPPAPPQSLAALGSALLPALFDEFATRVEATPTEAADLHLLRIVGKRVRYAMELFATCYAPAFRDELYPAVEQAQSILGAIQDGHVARERLDGLAARLRLASPATAKRVKAGFQGLVVEVRKRITAEKRAYRKWDREWRKLVQAHPLAILRVPV